MKTSCFLMLRVLPGFVLGFAAVIFVLPVLSLVGWIELSPLQCFGSAAIGGAAGGLIGVARARCAASIKPPYFGLCRYGKGFVPSIVFTSDRDRREFLRLADWFCRDFGAEIVEEYGGVGPDDKEYWTLRVTGSKWMLMRCYYPPGISLNSDSPRDLPVFERIAAAVSAVPVGWPYRRVLFRRWLSRYYRDSVRRFFR